MRSECFAPENDSIHPSTHWQHNADLCAPTLCAAKEAKESRFEKKVHVQPADLE